MDRTINVIRYPMEYISSKIRIHAKCENELRDLTERSGNKARLKSDYKKRLQFLEKHMERAIEHREWFESLSGEADLYSMRFVSVGNIRIIYVIQKNVAYLLCAFTEKSDSTNQSYAPHIKIARTRQADL